MGRARHGRIFCGIEDYGEVADGLAGHMPLFEREGEREVLRYAQDDNS